MTTLEQLEKGVELEKQITVLDILVREKMGTIIDIMRRYFERNSYEQVEIDVLKRILKEKRDELGELVKECQSHEKMEAI